MCSRPPLDLTDKVAILVDDGIATGATSKAALRMINQSIYPAHINFTGEFLCLIAPQWAGNAKRVVLAVPVMPSDRVNAFRKMVDELVYVQAPQVVFLKKYVFLQAQTFLGSINWLQHRISRLLGNSISNLNKLKMMKWSRSWKSNTTTNSHCLCVTNMLYCNEWMQEWRGNEGMEEGEAASNHYRGRPGRWEDFNCHQHSCVPHLKRLNRSKENVLIHSHCNQHAITIVCACTASLA